MQYVSGHSHHEYNHHFDGWDAPHTGGEPTALSGLFEKPHPGEPRSSLSAAGSRLCQRPEEDSSQRRLKDFYGLQSGSQVSLLVTEPVVPPVVPPVDRIQVLLKNVNGATKPYDVNPDETVRDFKRKVQNREGVAESQQHLIHEGKEMNAGRLSDYNVRAGSLIILTLHLRGGHGLN